MSKAGKPKKVRSQREPGRQPATAERQRGISRLLGFLVAFALLLFIVVMVLSQLFDAAILKAPRELVARVITPIQHTFASGTDFVVDYLRTLKLRSNLEYEYKQLQEKIDELTNKAMLAESLQQQVQSYADLNDEVGRNPGLNGIKANIIGRDTSNYSFVFTLDVGKNQGVDNQMAVVVPGALVGITFDALDNTCKVRGIIDTNVAVEAIIQSSRDPGTVSGTLAIDGTYSCRMYYLSYTTLPRPGDMVVTSGMNTGLPKGIPIGRVRESTRGMEDSKQYIVLEPLADFDHIEYVIVYRYQQTAGSGERRIPAQATFVPMASIRPVPTLIGQEPPAIDPDATPSPTPSPTPEVTESPTPAMSPDFPPDYVPDEGVSYVVPLNIPATETIQPTEAPITPSPSPTFSPEDMTVEEDP